MTELSNDDDDYLERKSKEDSKDPGRAYLDLYHALDRMIEFTIDAPYRPYNLGEINLMNEIFAMYEKIGECIMISIDFTGEVHTMKQALLRLKQRANDFMTRDQHSSNDALH